MRGLGHWGLLLTAGLWLAGVQPLDAVSFALNPREQDEAVRVGKRSVVSEDFGAEWIVADGPGQTLTVMTSFHRLALAARNAAFRNQPLRPRDIDSLLREQEGQLVFWATLRGPKADFARFYAPVLLSRDQEINATFTQNERTALRDEDGRYTARCMWVFPTEALNPRGKVTLVVRDPNDRELARFTMDLSAMR